MTIQNIRSDEIASSDTEYEYLLNRYMYYEQFENVQKEIDKIFGCDNFAILVARNLFDTLAKIYYPYENFEKLPFKSKRALAITLYRIRNADLLKGYLFVFHLTQSVNVEFLDFIFNNSAYELTIKNFDYSHLEELQAPSENFEKFMKSIVLAFWRAGIDQYYEHGNFNMRLTTLLLLSKKYGEDLVIDVLSKVLETGEDISLLSFAKLIPDWGNVKEYPLQWAVELTDDGKVYWQT